MGKTKENLIEGLSQIELEQELYNRYTHIDWSL